METFNVNDIVYVKYHPEEGLAQISHFYETKTNGGLSLNRDIAGFHSWNVSDLVKITNDF